MSIQPDNAEPFIHELPIDGWIDTDLWHHFTSLNNGTPPRVLHIAGKFAETCAELERQLSQLPDSELVCVLLHSYVDSGISEKRVDHRIVVDRADFLKRRFIRFWHGKTELGKYEYLFGLSYYPNRNAIHLHTLSLGKGDKSKYRGKGLTSGTFALIVERIREFYPGTVVSAVALCDVGKHWCSKYFGACKFSSAIHPLNPQEYVHIEPHYVENLMIGYIS